MIKTNEFDGNKAGAFQLREIQEKYLNLNASPQEQDGNHSSNLTHVYSYESLDDIDEGDYNAEKKKCCPKLNRKLIVYKLFYFLFFGAVGALFPYLAVFYKQLWLSAHQVGILIGLRPFIQMCASPFWGALADTYNVGRAILLMSIGAWLISNFSISMVKPKQYEPTCDLNLTYLTLPDYMDGEEVHWPRINAMISKKDNITRPDVNDVDYSDVGSRVRDEHSMTGEDRRIGSLYSKVTPFALHEVKKTKTIYSYQAKDRSITEYQRGTNASNVGRRNSSIIRMKLLRTVFYNKQRRGLYPSRELRRAIRYDKFSESFNDRGNSLKVDNNKNTLFGKQHVNSNKKVSEQQEDAKSSSLGDRESEEYLQEMTNQNSNDGFYQNGILPNQRIIANDDLREEFDSLKAPNGLFWPIKDSIDTSSGSEAQNKPQAEETKNLFNILIAITVCGTFLSSPAATLADTATLQELGDNRYRYGQQRLWGAFGWGLGAFIVGTIVSVVQEIHQCADPKHVNYILSFYVYAFIMGLAFVCALFFKFEPVSETRYRESFWEAVKMFSDCQHVCFIVTLLCSGTAMGFTHTFLFWHLHDLGGSQFLFSIVAAVQCVSEVFMYLVSGYLILKIGCDSVLYIGLLANVIRLFAYSVITQPMFSVLLEVLQGVSSASIWTAAICYVGLNPGVQVTLQAILHGIYWGLGHGGGGMLGGLVVTYFGANATFIIFGIMCIINLLTLFFMKHWNKFLEMLGNYTSVENIPAGTYILIEKRAESHARATQTKTTPNIIEE